MHYSDNVASYTIIAKLMCIIFMLLFKKDYKLFILLYIFAADQSAEDSICMLLVTARVVYS
jgi:hypothetical protein